MQAEKTTYVNHTKSNMLVLNFTMETLLNKVVRMVCFKCSDSRSVQIDEFSKRCFTHGNFCNPVAEEWEFAMKQEISAVQQG